MDRYKIVGNTQVIGMTTTPGSEALTNTGHHVLLIQSDDAAAGGSSRIKIGASGVAVTLSTDGTSGVVLHGGLPGILVQRENLNIETDIAHVASAGTPNLYITPVTPVS